MSESDLEDGDQPVAGQKKAKSESQESDSEGELMSSDDEQKDDDEVCL